MLFMVDTCQANTLFSKFYSPNIIATGSSSIHENSYSVRLFWLAPEHCCADLTLDCSIITIPA